VGVANTIPHTETAKGLPGPGEYNPVLPERKQYARGAASTGPANALDAMYGGMVSERRHQSRFEDSIVEGPGPEAYTVSGSLTKPSFNVTLKATGKVGKV
jgi:hypothetical protein